MFAVDDVTNSADSLAKNETNCAGIGERRDWNLVFAAIQIGTENAKDDATVNGDATFRDIKDGNGVGGVKRPLVDDVQQASTNDAGNDGPRRGIEDMVG